MRRQKTLLELKETWKTFTSEKQHFFDFVSKHKLRNHEIHKCLSEAIDIQEMSDQLYDGGYAAGYYDGQRASVLPPPPAAPGPMLPTSSSSTSLAAVPASIHLECGRWAVNQQKRTTVSEEDPLAKKKRHGKARIGSSERRWDALDSHIDPVPTADGVSDRGST